MRAISFAAVLFWIAGALGSGLVLLALSPEAPLAYTVGALVLALFAIVSPHLAILVFVASLPFFGNRPGTPQALACLYGAMGLVLGLAPRMKRLIPEKGDAVDSLVTGFTLAALFSLAGLPLWELYDDFRASVPALRMSPALQAWLMRFITSTEEQLSYSVLTVFSTILSCSIFHAARGLARTTPAFARQLVTAIFAGFVLTLVAGLADYYGLISLGWLRGLDPVVNPGGVQFRLQSFFGHSGWFAEYLTLAAASVLTLLLFSAPFWLRVLLIVLVLVLGEFALILSFQRGGWLAYPLTLLVVWAAIYVFRCVERGESSILPALKKSMVKVLISLPLTLAASVILVSVFARSDQSESSRTIERYFGRFKDIAKTSDRTEFIHTGFLIGGLSPVLGTGSESFAFQYRRELANPEGAYPGRYDLPLHGTAHNVYAQTFAGKGIVGLGILLALLFLIVRHALRSAIAGHDTPPSGRIVSLFAACFATAFLIYGAVQEVFYILPLKLLFFTVPALLPLCPLGRMGRRLPLVLALAFVAHILWNWFPGGRVLREYSATRSFGCQDDPALSPPGTQWCGVRARMRVPAEKNIFELQAAPVFTSKDEATIQVYSADGGLLHEEIIRPGHTLRMKVDGTTNDGFIFVRTGAYLIPAHEFSGSRDFRTLSYQARFTSEIQ